MASGSSRWLTRRPTGRPGTPPSAARLPARDVLRPRRRVAGPGGSPAASRGGDALSDHWLIYDGDRVAAVYCGEQLDGHTYMTRHAAVHLDDRRRGIYRAV